MTARILSGLVGVVMLLSFLGWMFDPASAAAGLEMNLENGLGGNTQIGDFSAFFFTAGIFACLGAYRSEPNWLFTAISLLGSAAVFRVYAAVVYDTELLMSAVLAEVVMSAVLIVAVFLMKPSLN